MIWVGVIPDVVERVFRQVSKAFERMRAKAEPDMVNEACRLLVAEFEKLQMEPKARHYRQLLQVHG